MDVLSESTEHFSVGACYLTVTTFRNRNIIKNESNEPPIMLGPMYLHWDGTYHTYQRFLSHLQGQLHDIDPAKNKLYLEQTVKRL